MPTPSSSSGHVTSRMPVRRITSNAREGVPRLHRLDPLVAHALGARPCGTCRASARMARLGRRVERELEGRHEARGAQHAQAVLREALQRIADGAEQAARRGRPRPSKGSMILPSLRVDRDGVHGEVAAGEVGRDVVDELDPVGAPAVGVGALPAQRGDLVVVSLLDDGHGPVLDAGGDGPREDAEELVGPGVGGHVPVVGRAAEEHVAHAPPDDPGPLARASAGARRAPSTSGGT